MNARFRFDKTLQATCRLLELDGGRMDRVRLLKLLYIADRELLAETGRSLTGDRAHAMQYGPVLSATYDLIKQAGPRSEAWSQCILSRGYALFLKASPGLGKLSRGEVAKLEDVSRRHQDMDDFQLCDETHNFPEWKRYYAAGKATAIPWESILEAQGKGAMIEDIREEEEQAASLDALFAE